MCTRAFRPEGDTGASLGTTCAFLHGSISLRDRSVFPLGIFGFEEPLSKSVVEAQLHVPTVLYLFYTTVSNTTLQLLVTLSKS